MAQWTQVLFVVFALPAFVSCRRVRHSTESGSLVDSQSVPKETQDALTAWMSKQAYRYLIMTVPDMTVQTAPVEKNFADFKQHLMSCQGVCFGAYDFSWRSPRGQGFVPTAEPVLFAWAPDSPPEGLPMMKYMRMKMQISHFKQEIKKALNDWNGAFIQANSEAELSPDWIVPKLRGGRGGSRLENFSPELKALYEQLQKELGEGSSGVPPIPIPDKPKPDVPLEKPKPNRPAPVTPPVGRPMTGSKEQVENFITQMVERAFDAERDGIMKAAKEAAQIAVSERPGDAIDEIAKEAARQAVAEMFTRISSKLNP